MLFDVLPIHLRLIRVPLTFFNNSLWINHIKKWVNLLFSELSGKEGYFGSSLATTN